MCPICRLVRRHLESSIYMWVGFPNQWKVHIWIKHRCVSALASGTERSSTITTKLFKNQNHPILPAPRRPSESKRWEKVTFGVWSSRGQLEMSISAGFGCFSHRGRCLRTSAAQQQPLHPDHVLPAPKVSRRSKGWLSQRWKFIKDEAPFKKQNKKTTRSVWSLSNNV